jgi:hypothetical protein
MNKDQPSEAPRSSQSCFASAEAVEEVLAMIEELTPVIARVQEVLDAAAGSVAKPSRAELEGMRDLRQPVTPEAFLLARLHLASHAVESACSWLQSIDADCFLALKEAFAKNAFPLDLVQLRDLALGAGLAELVGREGVETALAFEQASAVQRAG